MSAMDAESVEDALDRAAERLAAAAPPLTPEQMQSLRSLLALPHWDDE